MKDRITQFLNKEGISPAEFADKIGVQRSSVSHVLNGRNYPSASFIQKMLGSYKNINPRWLLLGEGNMSEIKSSQLKESTLFSHPVPGEAPKAPLETAKVEDNSSDKLSSQLVENFTDKPASAIGPNQPVELNLTQPMSDMMNSMVENKVVERIVLFFDDKTFTVYIPSK